MTRKNRLSRLTTPPSPGFSIPESLSAALVCPDCRARLVRDRDWFVCSQASCRRAYFIEDGIPRLLVSESRTLNEAEWELAVRTGQ